MNEKRQKIDLASTRGWRRVLFLLGLAWLGLIAISSLAEHQPIKRAFVERRNAMELPKASEQSVAQAIKFIQQNDGRACLPGTLWITRTEEMRKALPILIAFYTGRESDTTEDKPVLTTVLVAECITYDLLTSHLVWLCLLLTAIVLIAIVGGWVSRGFTR